MLDKARGAANGDRFAALSDRGDLASFGDESKADLALCAYLAFWTGKDAKRIDRLFPRSGLYCEKFDRDDGRDLEVRTSVQRG